MKEVANLFGLKLNEEFNIKGQYLSNPYCFTDENLVSSRGLADPAILSSLLIGALQIEKKPFKPKLGGAYYSVNYDGKVSWEKWLGYTIDYHNYNIGNCFRTSEEINRDDIDRILKEMKGKYEEVEE